MTDHRAVMAWVLRFVVGFLAFVVPAAGHAVDISVVAAVHTYDTTHYDVPTTVTATERGPPVKGARLSVPARPHAVDRAPDGSFSHPHASGGRAEAHYDVHPKLAHSASITAAGKRHVGVIHRSLAAFPRTGVAAKTGPGVGKALELSPWPANSGFMHEPVETVLKAGTRVDRFGADAGTFTAQVGTPLRQRAMRQGAENAPYSVFELQQDITVRGGITAPAFGQPGGGIQYQFPSSMASLLESGAIRRLP